jgi:hypothetical protein
MLQHLLHDDLELLDVIAEEIIPRLGSPGSGEQRMSR